MEATKPKGVLYQPKRVRKLPKLTLKFDEQSMCDAPTSWRSALDKKHKCTVPTSWKKTFETNYSVFHDNLKPQSVIKHMQLSDVQKDEISNMINDYQRTDHLIKQILPNGTKSLVTDFRNALKLSGQDDLIQFTPGGRGLKRQASVDSGLKSERNVPIDDLPLMVHVNGQKYLKLIYQHDKPIINLREYITDINGKLHPTKKGILLTLEDWNLLSKVNISTLIQQQV